MSNPVKSALAARFGTDVPVPVALQTPALAKLAARGSCRAFQPTPPTLETLQALAALALCAPSKSDLQQRDVILIRDPAQTTALKTLLKAQDWISGVPAFVVICANNRRQRQWHAMHAIPFANDHLDAMFNASVDAALALGAFIFAAEQAGLGCCPISTIRNHLPQVRDLLALPDHVFPVAALAVGTPATPSPERSMRLPLNATVHVDQFNEADTETAIREYDTRRETAQPFSHQRGTAQFGTARPYGWSLDKARQYSAPERTDFAAFLRDIGFSLK